MSEPDTGNCNGCECCDSICGKSHCNSRCCNRQGPQNISKCDGCNCCDFPCNKQDCASECCETADNCDCCNSNSECDAECCQ